MDTIVEDAGVIGAADPGKVGRVKMTLHFVHLDLGMPIVHVADILAGKLD